MMSWLQGTWNLREGHNKTIGRKDYWEKVHWETRIGFQTIEQQKRVRPLGDTFFFIGERPLGLGERRLSDSALMDEQAYDERSSCNVMFACVTNFSPRFISFDFFSD